MKHWMIYLTVACATGLAISSRAAEKSLPKLIDFGAHKCQACIEMTPVLDALKKEYAGTFETQFIDVWEKKNAETAKAHKINLIPTQIFFDQNGKELWRHEGFLSKQAILDKWKELGVDLPEKPGAGAGK